MTAPAKRGARLATPAARAAAIALGLAAAIILAAGLVFFGAKLVRQQAFTNVGPNGVAEVVAVPVRGADQYLFIRGENRAAPLLIFLPGGPGESMVPLARDFTRALERHFVVAHVEFGVGKAEPYVDGPDMAQFVADAETLIDRFRSRFDDRKVILVGHSLGSIQAYGLIERAPEKYAGLVTLGQTVDWPQGNRLAHAEVRARAEAANDAATLAALDAIPPSLTAGDDPLMIDFAAVARQREILAAYGMETVLGAHTPQARRWAYLTSPHHTLAQACNLLWSEGSPCAVIGRSPDWWRQWSGLIPDVLSFNAFAAVETLPVPALILAGSNDWICPAGLTRRFAAQLDGPQVSFVLLEGAGHYAHLDDPEAFQRAVIDAFAAE